MCTTHPQLVFHCRARIRHYLPLELQGTIVGASKTALGSWFDDTLIKLNKDWAKKVLINSEPLNKQYWTRRRIKENTPKFVLKIQGIDEKYDDTIVINQDSTYQYTYTVQSSHNVRKLLKSPHKNCSLIKIHIWATTNGKPILAVYCFGDGGHSDGRIFQASTDKKHVKKCKEAIKNNEINDKIELVFKKEEVCKELENLQALLRPYDHCISDNGYQIPDPRIRAPRDPPKDNDEGGRITVLAASHKRSITAIRQTQERLNKECKRNKMLARKIYCDDIKRVPLIWNIVLADINHADKVLMEDDEDSELLAERIIDMRNVAINPADIYRIEKDEKKQNKKTTKQQKAKTKKNTTKQQNTKKKKKKEKKKQKKKNKKKKRETHFSDDSDDTYVPNLSQKTDYTESDCDDCNDENTDTDCHSAENESHDDDDDDDDDDDNKNNNNNNTNKKSDWIIKGKKWDGIQKFLKEYEITKIFNIPPTEDDVLNYIGKKWQNKLGIEYLRRMNLYEHNFKILQHKHDDKVIMFQNVKSKYTCANRYNVIFSFKQIELYIKSYVNVFNNGTYEIADDEKHWYLALKSQQKVSSFLHDKYKKEHELLTEKRVQRLKKSKALWYDGINYNDLYIHDLRDMATELDIPLGTKNSKTTKKQLIKLIISKKKKIDEKKKEEKFTKMNEKELLKYCKDNDIKITNKNAKKKQIMKIILQNIKKQHIEEINHIKYIGKKTIPESLEYLKKYPLEKSWYDIDFQLFNSKFARLQASCSCKSGAQIPGCCAHIGACLLLVQSVAQDNLDAKLKETKRDQMILNTINDLSGYKIYKKNNKIECFACQQKKKDDTFLCDKCKTWYHASCIGATANEIDDTLPFWFCPNCDARSVFICRHT